MSKIGNKGEREVVRLISCPNCRKKLILLPTNNPLFDVQCSACMFRAQVKTNNRKPGSRVRGAGWEIMDKVLKSGFMAPPLILNYKWKEKNKKRHKILFYPFISRSHMRMYQLSPTARRANYKMFNYVNLDKLPSIVLFEK